LPQARTDFDSRKIENKKSSETQVVNYLSDLKGAVLTMDALLCKKTAGQNCSDGQSTEAERGA
jgi:hypothetical protein